MKKYSIALFLVQFLTSTVMLVTESRAFSSKREEVNKQAEERDLETELNQERDVFPDIITFATHLYQ